MTRMVYMRDDFIFRQGDIGHELFILAHGTVFVLPDDVASHVKREEPIILTEGAYFGEIGIFMEVERTRSVQAQTMTEVNILDQDGFNKVATAYPAFALQIRDLVIARLRSSSTSGNSEHQERFIRQLKRSMDERIKRNLEKTSWISENAGADRRTRSDSSRLQKAPRRSSIEEVHNDIDEEIKQERTASYYDSNESSSSIDRKLNHIAQQLADLQNELKTQNNMKLTQ